MRREQLLVPALAMAIAAGGSAGCDGCDGEDESAAEDAGEAATEFGLTEEQAAQVLAKVGDTTITVGEFAQQLADQSPYLRARYNSPERRREFLDNMIRFELLALEAREKGFHELSEVQRTRRQVMVQQMMKELFEDRIQLSDITDEEIREYYESHREEFHKPEQVRASHILISSESTARDVHSQLAKNPNDINLFRQLAEEHHEDEATEERFGDLGFFARPGEGDPDESAEVPSAVAEAAFEIDRIGGIYPELVKTEAGRHIVKLTGRRAAMHRSLDQAKRSIQNRLWRQEREKAVDAFVTELREKADVQENMDLLGEVKIDAPEGSAADAQGGTAGQAGGD
ncbi:MAG: peptidyl-prolyl cis-trans isomerase [Myxococcota bacterium]